MTTRQKYAEHGVDGFYRRYGSTYRNPHEPQVRELTKWAIERLHPTSAIDLACGSGEVSLVFQEHRIPIQGIDPYCHMAYKERVGQDALQMTFFDVVTDEYRRITQLRKCNVVVCSYALHLIQGGWELKCLLRAIRTLAPKLVVITPTKRPKIEPETGWTLKEERLFERVRCRIYSS